MILNAPFKSARVAPEKRKLSPPADIYFESILKERLEMKEVWMPVVGYETRYKVSNLGNIWSVYKQGNLKQCLHRDGYPQVGICGVGVQKSRRVHRLVLDAFVGLRPTGFEASHLDGNRKNNRIDNLVWESGKDNCARKERHGTKAVGEQTNNAKFKEADILEIRKLSSEGVFQRVIAKRFNTIPRRISEIVTRKTWRHI